MSEESSQVEDVVAKYKRLLALARSSLEANQSTLASKDKQISQLTAALEELRLSSKQKSFNNYRDDENAVLPRSILRRVDVNENIWILLEYENASQEWNCFKSEDELSDFIQRIPGAPLTIPHRCLTPFESAKCEAEAQKKVDRVVEEFRRYKVRTEIARNQKSTETKISTPNIPGLEKNVESLNDSSVSNDNDMKWKQAYEKVVSENELLRTRGGDSLLLSQLRERYETCLREKDDLYEKLQVYMKLSDNNTQANGNVGVTSKTIEQLYIELKDENKELRRRMIFLEGQRKNEIEEIKNTIHRKVKEGHLSFDEEQMKLLSSRAAIVNDDFDSESTKMFSSSMSNGYGNEVMKLTPTMEESKFQYIRHMVFQYLSCCDPVVKPHIEDALIAIFRYNSEERFAIESRSKEESQDTLTSLGSFLGSLTNI